MKSSKFVLAVSHCGKLGGVTSVTCCLDFLTIQAPASLEPRGVCLYPELELLVASEFDLRARDLPLWRPVYRPRGLPQCSQWSEGGRLDW